MRKNRKMGTDKKDELRKRREKSRHKEKRKEKKK
jgi:hypothetical protein